MKRWLWDRKRRKYVDTRGSVLTKRELTEGIDEYIENIKASMTEKVAEYTAGRITANTLFNFLEDEITSMHGASGSIAYGGLEQMDAEKFARIDARLQSELSYLNQFKSEVAKAAEIATVESPLSAEGIANRAGLYAEAGYGEFWNQTVEREKDFGVIRGRRIVEDDDRACDECIAAALDVDEETGERSQLDFTMLDEIPEIGSLQCGSNCRCEIEFSIEGQEFQTSEIFQGVISGQEKYGEDAPRVVGRVIPGVQ